jgi:predicted nuclease with TOPRIM domain
MSKINYKKLYEDKRDFVLKLVLALTNAEVSYSYNLDTGDIKIINNALERCKKEYRKSADKLNIYIQDKNAEIRDKDKTIKTQENHISQLVEEYNDLKTEFEELSDNYFTLKTKYDELCEKYSFSETLRHILVKYIINN